MPAPGGWFILLKEVPALLGGDVAELKWNKQEALGRTGNDEALLHELMGLLEESVDQGLQKIETALTGSQAKEVATAAHSVKGAAANLAVESIREVAFRLETAGKAGDLDQARNLLPKLSRLAAQLKTLLN